MTSFGWWQAQVMAASQGKTFMCMLCFAVFPVGEAYEDAIGQRWDICKPCDASDKELLRARDALTELTGGAFAGAELTRRGIEEFQAEAGTVYCPQCRMPVPRHKMDCSEARNQPGPQDGPSGSESPSPDPTLNI